MKIKNRLSLYFTLVSSTILLIVMLVIYLSFYEFLQIEFYNRLRGRIDIVTRLFIEADIRSAEDLVIAREKYQERIPGEILRIYDARNHPAFLSEEQKYWEDNSINKIRENGDIEYSENGSHIVGVHYKMGKNDFVILASAPDPDRIRQLHRFLIIMAILLFLSVILVFGIARWFSEKALSPINKFIHQLQKINAENLFSRVTVVHENDEIGLLAKDFNYLLSQLERAFELQKTFITNISHEFRTPITTMIGEAEVSLRFRRTSDEYEAVILSMLAEAEKLNNTISGLIDFAQVDTNFTRAVIDPIRVDDLIWELEEFWADRLYPNALKVTMLNISSDESALIIKANKALLTIALNNIIGNAFKFSGNEQVTCMLETRDGGVIITIMDDGIGITIADRELIFDAFYRSERSSNYPGSGIGLYVTQKIIRLLNGEIEVHSILNSGTIIVVKFKSTCQL